MVKRSSVDFSALALVLSSMASITLGASIAKTLFSLAGPAGVSATRIGIGAFLLALFWRPWRFSFSREQLAAIIPYGICLGAMNLLFYQAIARLPIGLAIALEFLGPLSVALLYSRRMLDIFWAALAAVGIVLILPLAEISTSVDLVGVAYALGAAAAWALYIVLGKRAGRGSHAGAVTSVGMILAFLTVLPFGFQSAGILLSTTGLALTALAVGLLSSALPYSLEMFALKKIPEKHFGLLMSLEPAIGASMAFLFLGETLTVVQGLAVACIVNASAGSTYSNRETPLEPTPQ